MSVNIKTSQLRWIAVATLACVAAGLVGCERSPEESNGTKTPSNTAAPAPAPSTSTATPATPRNTQPSPAPTEPRDPGNTTRPVQPTPPSTTDASLAEQVRTAIQADKTMSSTLEGLQVEAVNGSIRLTGTVGSKTEKDAIEAKVRAMAGVKGLTNDLKIKTP